MLWIIPRPVSAATNPALVLTLAGALLLFRHPHFRIGDDLIDHHVFLVGQALIDPAFEGEADPCSVRRHDPMVAGYAQLGRSVLDYLAGPAGTYALVTHVR